MEGRERQLRTLFRDRVVLSSLGWPPEKAISGELLDIYCHDDLGFVVLYFETKTPNRTALASSERHEFERKLQEQGTCKAGLLTNGHEILAYTVSRDRGGARVSLPLAISVDEIIREIDEGRLSSSNAAKLGEAFEPLRANHYIGVGLVNYAGEYGSIQPRGGDPNANHLLSVKLRMAIDLLTEEFQIALRDLLRLKIPIGESTSSSFSVAAPLDDWATFSGRVPPTKILETVRATVDRLDRIRSSGGIPTSQIRKEARQLTKAFGISVSEPLLSRLIASFASTPDSFLADSERMIFDLIDREYLAVFARQTSYVVLNRILLYRVAEDKDLVTRIMSGAELDLALARQSSGQFTQYLRGTVTRSLLDQAESLMTQSFYSHLYSHGLFDWWDSPIPVRNKYDSNQKQTFDQVERSIDSSLGQVVRILNRFRLDRVERDVWKDIYQNYLSQTERARLGGFYTPDDVVEFILDQVDYRPGAPICKSLLLDPSCGSGTFLVQAVLRLRDHLGTTAPCHKELTGISDSRERSWAVLQTVIRNIQGIDIHPFACFLSEMNVLLSTVDLLADAKRVDASRMIQELNIGCDDSLRKPAELVQLKLSNFSGTNSRATNLLRDKETARRIKSTRVDFVVGNPPWSGVLRGELSPLFDEKTKELYKREYPISATGKYDISVLFYERGIRWLKEGRKIGFISPNRFLRRGYGVGLRRFVKLTSKIVICIDLSRIGKTIFPRQTTYPAIVILEKVRDAR